MSRTIALFATVLTAFSFSGCLFDDVEGIPCESDDQCPTTYSCDIPRHECGTVGIPALTIKKLRDPAGDLVLLPHVAPGGASPIAIQIINDGKGPAGDVGISFSFLACLDITIPEDSIPDVVDAGKTVLVEATVTTGGDECAGIKIVDWFLAYSGRETRGNFDVDIDTNAPPPEEPPEGT